MEGLGAELIFPRRFSLQSGSHVGLAVLRVCPPKSVSTAVIFCCGAGGGSVCWQVLEVLFVTDTFCLKSKYAVNASRITISCNPQPLSRLSGMGYLCDVGRSLSQCRLLISVFFFPVALFFAGRS